MSLFTHFHAFPNPNDFFCDTKVYKISTKVDIFRLIWQNQEKWLLFFFFFFKFRFRTTRVWVNDDSVMVKMSWSFSNHVIYRRKLWWNGQTRAWRWSQNRGGAVLYQLYDEHCDECGPDQWSRLWAHQNISQKYHQITFCQSYWEKKSGIAFGISVMWAEAAKLLP